MLTGLNQKVGNYPGVTVDKRSGSMVLSSGEKLTLIDLPGTYSLSSNSLDEEVVQKILLDPSNIDYPDGIVMVVDATNLKRNLFLASQIYDLEIPMVLALNMLDVLEQDQIRIDIAAIKTEFNCPIVEISAKKRRGIEVLKSEIELLQTEISPRKSFIEIDAFDAELSNYAGLLPEQNKYQRFKILNQLELIDWLNNKVDIQNEIKSRGSGYAQELNEINLRYKKINDWVKQIQIDKKVSSNIKLTKRIDRIVTHPILGLLTFLLVFFVIFQVIFTFATYPMDWIDGGMTWFGSQVATLLPEGLFNDFIVNGLLAGIGGVLVFLPQIMLLFGMISILEDTGYLARVSFMSDGLLRKFGMNGKSVVPLVSGFACAIPAIMAARTIENRKERLITIFITPLMSCSARLPVYVFLVSFLVPNEKLWGIISFQGLMMMAMYLLGLVVSFLVALLINSFLKSKELSSFILELPNYQTPSFRNAYNTMINKGLVFVKEAGKIIVVAAIVIWALANIVPSAQKTRITQKYETMTSSGDWTKDEIAALESSEMLEFSYLGYIGKSIEPVIRPLGFDWKIGIAVTASFAAREVFVGTMATIYAVEDNVEGERGLKSIKFSYPVAFSLLIFYVFALQCMSTIAIVRQETGGWKWPFIQFISFTALAYFAAWLTYLVTS